MFVTVVVASGIVGTGISVNGQGVATAASNLAELLGELGYAGRRVATAVNGCFVAEANRTSTCISPGDKIEILAPRQGG